MRRVSCVCRCISSRSHRSTLNVFFFLITALPEWKDGLKELHWRSKYCSFFIEFAIEMIRRSRPRFPQWTRSPSKTSCNNPRSFSPYKLGSVPVVMHVYVKRFYAAKRRCQSDLQTDLQDTCIHSRPLGLSLGEHYQIVNTSCLVCFSFTLVNSDIASILITNLCGKVH